MIQIVGNEEDGYKFVDDRGQEIKLESEDRIRVVTPPTATCYKIQVGDEGTFKDFNEEGRQFLLDHLVTGNIDRYLSPRLLCGMTFERIASPPTRP